MDPDKQTALTSAIRDLVVNLAKLFGALCVMAFCFGGPSTRAWMTGFIIGVAGLTGEPSAGRATPFASDAPPPLRLLGHGCRKEQPYLICEGEVRNITGQPLDSVMAEIRFKDQAGTFVKAESALIDYQPLMPGQTSPFKVYTMGNPQIWHFSFGFREMFGGALKAAR